LAVGVAAEVKNKLSVVDVVGETVSLKKAGTTYKGLCPFHGEKTPSFVVTPGRDSWHCFGCGLGGDIFSFVMQRDSVPFPEALKILAAKAGVEIDERTKREDVHKARLRSVLDSAIAFYHAVLTNSAAGTTALDWFFPSQDGRLLAYGLSENGSEQSVLRVRDVDRGADLTDLIPHTRAADLAWLPDGSGFYYTRYPAGGEVPEGEEAVAEGEEAPAEGEAGEQPSGEQETTEE